MKNDKPKSMADLYDLVSSTFGKDCGAGFEFMVDDYVYFVRMTALSDLQMSDEAMKAKLRKFANGIVLASIRDYAERNYENENGDLCIDFGFGLAYDKEMRPIDPINRIKEALRPMVSVMVTAGMDEFVKGRDIALAMLSRATRERGQGPEKPSLRSLESERTRLEAKLPNIDGASGKRLLEVYREIKDLQEGR